MRIGFATSILACIWGLPVVKKTSPLILTNCNYCLFRQTIHAGDPRRTVWTHLIMLVSKLRRVMVRNDMLWRYVPMQGERKIDHRNALARARDLPRPFLQQS